MPENIVDIARAIELVKGREYVVGMVAMANLLAPQKPEEPKTKPV